MADKVEITKEEYDAIKNQELQDSNLAVYEVVDNQQDADDLINSMEGNSIDDQTLYEQGNPDDLAYSYDPNKTYVYTSSDNSKYIDKNSSFANTTATSPGQPYNGGTIGVSCSDIQSNFSQSLKISANFTLGDVAVHFDRLIDKTVNGKNYNKYQIACNLKALTVNCLDKIKLKYSDMTINSSIRNDGCRSEHETGQAADLKFPTHLKSDYYNIIQWIYQNIPFNQLFLEYRPNSNVYKGVSYTGNPKGGWIHISYAQQGNQVYGAPKFWGCMVNDKFDSPGAKLAFTNPMANNNWT